MTERTDRAYQQALAAVPDGHCALLVQHTRTRVRDRRTGEIQVVEWNEFNTAAEVAFMKLMMAQLDNGMADLDGLPETEYRHPEDCPACTEAALPGPLVYGVWLPQDWYHEHVRADLAAGNLRSVERFANRELAEQVVAGRLAALTRSGTARSALGTQTMELARRLHEPPYFGLVFVHASSQLWLWDSDPTGPGARSGRRRSWPDYAVVFNVEAQRVVTVAAAQLRNQVATEEARIQREQDRRRAEATTGFLVTVLDGCTLTWYRHKPSDPGALVAIVDPESTRPARRVVGEGTVEPLHDSTPGLTVYGRSVSDRPSFHRAAGWTPEYATLIAGLARGHGHTGTSAA
jgi:hypothetical protein